MALFGQLTRPAKSLPLIDISNADIMMELLEELAITASTSQWIEAHEPYHPEAQEIHEQAKDVYEDLLSIMRGKTRDKRVNRRNSWCGDELSDHLAKNEKNVDGDVIEFALKRFLNQFMEHARAPEEGRETMSRKDYYAFMSGWAHYFAGLAPDETPPVDPEQ